jgi:hypothetical protein
MTTRQLNSGKSGQSGNSGNANLPRLPNNASTRLRPTTADSGLATDEKYEFRAPKYHDFLAGSDDSKLDQWFGTFQWIVD